MMNPQTYLEHLELLRQAIRELSEHWTMVLCTRDQCLVAVTTLLLEQAIPVAASTAELLTLELPQEHRLLVICDDSGSDGGAEELMLQMRHRHGPRPVSNTHLTLPRIERATTRGSPYHYKQNK